MMYSVCPLNEPGRTEMLTPATSKTEQQSLRVSHRNVFIHLQGWLCLSSVGVVARALRFTFMGPQTKRRVATWTRNSSVESTDGLWTGGIANSTTQHQSLQVHWVQCLLKYMVLESLEFSCLFYLLFYYLYVLPMALITIT